MHDARTYKTQLAIAADRLRHAGLAKPLREARQLMQHACGLSAAELIRDELDEMPGDQRSAFFDLIERRAAGEPVEYLTGKAHFYGLDLACSNATLIPRADSEVVIGEALARLPLGRDPIIADLGTGTGCLLIALLKNHPGARGTGVEQSPEAAAIARQNLGTHGLEGRATIHVGSWTSWDGWHESDLIVSNPPYIASDIIPTLDTSVRLYEPHEALDGGVDGLTAYRSIISLAAQGMKSGAWLVLEIGFDQGGAVTNLLKQAGFSTISCGQDTGQRDRVVSAKR